MFQPDPNHLEVALKVDSHEGSLGLHAAGDALRYLVATKPRAVVQKKSRGL